MYSTLAINVKNYTKKWNIKQRFGRILGLDYSNREKAILYKFNKGRARTLQRRVMSSIEEKSRSLVINDSHTRIYYLAALPDYCSLEYIQTLLNFGLPIQFSYFITATNLHDYVSMLRTRKSILLARTQERQKRGADEDPGITKEVNDIEQLISSLLNEGQRVFDVGIYVTLSSSNQEDLIQICKQFEDVIGRLDIRFDPATFRQKLALPSVLPFANDTLHETIQLQTRATVELLPFLTSSTSEASGFYIGTSRSHQNALVIFDPFQARNANILILGTSGSGKSVTSKSLLLKFVMRGIQCIVLDVEGEYTSICKKCGGNLVSFNGRNCLNIFALEFTNEESKRNHITVLKNFFKFIISSDRYNDAKLDAILIKLYSGKRLTMKRFMDLATEAKAEFIDDLAKLTTGSLSGIFGDSKPIDFSADVISFDLSSLGNDDLKLPVMYVISSIINNLLDRADRKRMVFIDEAHLFLNTKFTREFYIRLQKTVRKRLGGVVSITQNVEDYTQSDKGHSIVTQSETTFLLKQHAASVNYMQRLNLFDLSSEQYIRLHSLEKGEAILIREQERMLISIEPFNTEWDIINK
jgi:conjugal transfer ATP-binding protein TraC